MGDFHRNRLMQLTRTLQPQKSLTQARSLGQMQLQTFVKQRILLSERSESKVSIVEEGTEENFHDPIRKNNPPTFANLYEVKPPPTSSEKKKKY